MRIKIVSKCFSNNSDSSINSQKEKPITSFESRNKVEDVNHTEILEQYNTSFQDLNPNVINGEQISSQYTQQKQEFNSDSSSRELKQLNSSLQNLNSFILNEREEQLSAAKNKNQINCENIYKDIGNLGAKLELVNTSAPERKKKRRIVPKKKNIFKVCNPDEELEQSNGLLRKFNADIRGQKQRKRSATPSADIISGVSSNLIFNQDNYNSQKHDSDALSEKQALNANISSSNEIKDSSQDPPELEISNNKSENQCVSLHGQSPNFYFTKCKESGYVNLNQGLDQYYTRVSNPIEVYELENLTYPFITVNNDILSSKLDSENIFQQSFSTDNEMEMEMEMTSIPKEDDEELKRAKAIVANYMAEEERKFQTNKNLYRQ